MYNDSKRKTVAGMNQFLTSQENHFAGPVGGEGRDTKNQTTFQPGKSMALLTQGRDDKTIYAQKKEREQMIMKEELRRQMEEQKAKKQAEMERNIYEEQKDEYRVRKELGLPCEPPRYEPTPYEPPVPQEVH